MAIGAVDLQLEGKREERAIQPGEKMTCPKNLGHLSSYIVTKQLLEQVTCIVDRKHPEK
ncbi:hypothetical protein ACFLX3_05870 [Chloroflexota bacterium]